MRFLGREKELQILENFVHRSNNKILYIIGTRGVGKTSLIYHFIETKIKNDYHFINGLILSSISDLNNVNKGILIIDDLLDDISLSSEFLQNILKATQFKKIIITTNQKPLIYHTDISLKIDQIQILELKGLDIHIVKEIIFQRYKETLDERIKDLFETELIQYFDNNPRLVLTAIDFIHRKKDINFKDFQSFLETPFKQSGILDPQGNPIIKGTKGFKLVENKIHLINRSLVDLVYNNPDYIYKIQPHQFEELVAELLEREGYKVTITKKTHVSTPFFLQCKSGHFFMIFGFQKFNRTHIV